MMSFIGGQPDYNEQESSEEQKQQKEQNSEKDIFRNGTVSANNLYLALQKAAKSAVRNDKYSLENLDDKNKKELKNVQISQLENLVNTYSQRSFLNYFSKAEKPNSLGKKTDDFIRPAIIKGFWEQEAYFSAIDAGFGYLGARLCNVQNPFWNEKHSSWKKGVLFFPALFFEILILGVKILNDVFRLAFNLVRVCCPLCWFIGKRSDQVEYNLRGVNKENKEIQVQKINEKNPHVNNEIQVQEINEKNPPSTLLKNNLNLQQNDHSSNIQLPEDLTQKVPSFGNVQSLNQKNHKQQEINQEDIELNFQQKENQKNDKQQTNQEDIKLNF